MTMIERVGRALAAEEGYAYDPFPYDNRARAAIEAMRDPIPNSEALNFENIGRKQRKMDINNTFNAVINEALS